MVLYDEQFRVLDDNGKPLANVPYFIRNEYNETFKGVTDAQGLCINAFFYKGTIQTNCLVRCSCSGEVVNDWNNQL